jgi:hypothetical protein
VTDERLEELKTSYGKPSLQGWFIADDACELIAALEEERAVAKKLSRALAGVLSADGVIDDEPRTPQELVSRAKQWTRSKKGL